MTSDPLSPGQAAPAPRHVVLLVHGIRTFGAWQDRLAALLRQADPDIQVLVYKYGYFSALAFLVPFLRSVWIRRFRQHLAARSDAWHDTRVDIVAHSFGTYMVAWAIWGLARTRRPLVHTVILCGSVLKQLFPWHGPDGQAALAGRVINDCGLRDPWPRVALFTGFGMGSAGRHGLIGMTGVDAGIVNRYFPLGHSGFFSDDFMARHWVPLLTRDERPSGSELVSPTPSWLTVLEQWADPIKLIATALVVAAPLFVWQEQQRRVAEAEARVLRAQAKSDASALSAAEEKRRAAQAEVDRLIEAGHARQADAAREKAELRRKEEESLRLLADADNLLYRLPAQALLRAIQAAANGSGPGAARAQATALAVLRKRWENERAWSTEWRQVTSGWFVPPRFDGEFPARLSRDGSRLLFTTRGDGSQGPGVSDVFLLNYDTLKIARLEPPSQAKDSMKPDLRYFGFGSLGSKVYIARGRGNVQTYGLDGTFERSFELNVSKEYFTLVDGVDDDRSLLVGDSEGNVWLANASGLEVPRPIVRDWDIRRKPLARLMPSPSGRVAVLLHTEISQPAPIFAQPEVSGAVGRASVWWIGTTGQASAINLKHKGSVLDVAVSPTKDVDLVLTAGADGQAVLWQIAKKGARRVGSFDHSGRAVAFATFSDSGDQVLTVTDDGVPRLWQVPAAERLHGS